MPYEGIDFCTNRTSSFSAMTTLLILSLICKTDVSQRFHSKYSLRMLDILAHSLVRHVIRWGLFLFQSDVNFLFKDEFAYFQPKFSNRFSLQSHQSRGTCITSEHQLTYNLFKILYKQTFILRVQAKIDLTYNMGLIF